MMNVVALCLVATSLATAGLWSPSRDKADSDINIIKEGHRRVVVEYDREGQPITKVSISPESDQAHRFNTEADSVHDEPAPSHHRGPKELICDAYGKCVHRIADAAVRTKDSVAGTARRAEEAVTGTEAYDRASHGAEEAYHRAKDAAMRARDLGETISVDVAKNVTGFVGWLRREVAQKAALAGRMVSPAALNPVSGIAYILAFATAYGTGVWVTFVLSHVLAGALPRQQFAVVQSKIYPVYFRWMAALLATAVFWFAMSHRGVLSTRMGELWQVGNLLGSLLFVLVNAVFLEPRATKVMFEKMKLEKEEGGEREGAEQAATPESAAAGAEPERAEQEAVRSRIAGLAARLRKLNTWSSMLNILTLMSLSWHVYYLGNRLHITF